MDLKLNESEAAVVLQALSEFVPYLDGTGRVLIQNVVERLEAAYKRESTLDPVKLVYAMRVVG